MAVRTLSQTTVGAALRGRPFLSTIRVRRTGGHGGPPLQLLSRSPM